MRLPRRLAVRVALIAALSALAAIGTSSAIVWTTTARDLRDRARDNALSRLELAAEYYGDGNTLLFGSRVDDVRLPAVLRRAAVTDGRTTYTDGRTMWAAQRTGDGQVLSVTVPMEADRVMLRALLRRFAMAGLIAVVVAIGIGVIPAVGLTRRLRRIGQVAGRAASGSLDARVADTTPDEVGDLARAVDRMTANLGVMLERERRFSADVAHELRTPVAGLVTASEVLDDPRAQRLVRDRVQRLRRLVEDLLETFRVEHEEGTAACEPVDLPALVREVIDDVDPQATLDVREHAMVEVDRVRAWRVLQNLLANARAHGGGHARVVVDGPRVEVADDGPGFPDWLLQEGPQRFRTASASRGGGVGLGLTIAAHQARLTGAELVFTNPPGGGATAVVTFRRSIVTEP